MTEIDYEAHARALEWLNHPVWDPDYWDPHRGLLGLKSDYATAQWYEPLPVETALRVERIVKKYLGDPDQYDKDRRLIVTAGPAGGGKTTLCRRAAAYGIDLTGLLQIDPDRLRVMVLRDMLEHDALPIPPALRGGINGVPVSPLELSSLVHVEAVTIGDRLIEIAQSRGISALYDTSFSSEEHARNVIAGFRGREYSPVVALVTVVDAITARQRSLDRWHKERVDYDLWREKGLPSDPENDPLGGRYVPQALVGSHFDKAGDTVSLQVCERLAAPLALPGWRQSHPYIDRYVAVNTVSWELLHDSSPVGPRLPVRHRPVRVGAGEHQRVHATIHPGHKETAGSTVLIPTQRGGVQIPIQRNPVNLKRGIQLNTVPARRSGSDRRR